MRGGAQPALEPQQAEKVGRGEIDGAIEHLHAEQAHIGQGLEADRFDLAGEALRHALKKRVARPGGSSLHGQPFGDGAGDHGMQQRIGFGLQRL